MNKLTVEQVFLLGLARMVWTKRGAAKVAGLSFNEETITETILLDLQTNYPGHVQVVAFNKLEEAQTGADWLWSFVNANGSQSLTMLVQAKRLENSERSYLKLDQNIGKRTPPIRQIDQLLATAKQQNVPALYAFYNHVRQTSRIPHVCGSLSPSSPDHIHGFGISLADANAVAATMPDKTFDKHCLHSMPLHCLLCSGGSGVRPGGGTPAMAASGIALLREVYALDVGDPDARGLRQGLHPMVEFALGLASRRAEGIADTESKEIPGIAGVVVMRDAE